MGEAQAPQRIFRTVDKDYYDVEDTSDQSSAKHFFCGVKVMYILRLFKGGKLDVKVEEMTGCQDQQNDQREEHFDFTCVSRLGTLSFWGNKLPTVELPTEEDNSGENQR